MIRATFKTHQTPMNIETAFCNGGIRSETSIQFFKIFSQLKFTKMTRRKREFIFFLISALPYIRRGRIQGAMKAPFGANMFLTALNHLSCCSSDSSRNCSSSNEVASTQQSGLDPASALRGRKTCNTRHSRI